MNVMEHSEFMSAVKELESQIMEEVGDAEKYMGCADRWKNDAQVSSTYMSIAKQELDHAKKLQDMLPMIKGTEEFTPEQKTIITFLMDMNADQIRKVANR